MFCVNGGMCASGGTWTPIRGACMGMWCSPPHHRPMSGIILFEFKARSPHNPTTPPKRSRWLSMSHPPDRIDIHNIFLSPPNSFYHWNGAEVNKVKTRKNAIYPIALFHLNKCEWGVAGVRWHPRHPPYLRHPIVNLYYSNIRHVFIIFTKKKKLIFGFCCGTLERYFGDRGASDIWSGADPPRKH